MKKKKIRKKLNKKSFFFRLFFVFSFSLFKNWLNNIFRQTEKILEKLNFFHFNFSRNCWIFYWQINFSFWLAGFSLVWILKNSKIFHYSTNKKILQTNFPFSNYSFQRISRKIRLGRCRVTRVFEYWGKKKIGIFLWMKNL